MVQLREQQHKFPSVMIWFQWVVYLVLVALAAPLVWYAVERIHGLLYYPYPSDGLEGTLLSQAHLLWSGQQLYQPFELYRFVSAPYPPWHPLILGLADMLPGPHVFYSGRMVSIVAAAIVLVTVIVHVRIAGRTWLAGVLAAAILICAPPFILWATRIKPDMYALLWTALGLLCGSLALGSQRRTAWAFASAVACVLALFTKQTALVAPLAIGVAFVTDDLRVWWAAGRTKRWPFSRRTLLFGFGYVLLAAMIWLALDLWSHGQFTFHIWTQHRVAKWTPQLMGKYVALLLPYWPLMLLVPVVMVRAWFDRGVLVIMWYALLVPFSLYGAGKTGANHNHLLESQLALVLAGGVVLSWAFALFRQRPVVAVLLVLVFALQLRIAYLPQGWFTGELVRDKERGEAAQNFIDFMRSQPGEILADNTGLLYQAGKPLRYDDPSGIGPVAIAGLWDQSGMLDDIAHQRFSAIMLPVNAEKHDDDPTGRWTPEMLQTIREHYRLLYNDEIKIFIPK